MINIIQGFNVGSPLPIDGRIVLSRAEMLKCCDPNDPSFNTMPDRYFTICEEDRLFYLYSKEYDSEGNPVKASFDKAVPEKLSQLENDFRSFTQFLVPLGHHTLTHIETTSNSHMIAMSIANGYF